MPGVCWAKTSVDRNVPTSQIVAPTKVRRYVAAGLQFTSWCMVEFLRVTKLPRRGFANGRPADCVLPRLPARSIVPLEGFEQEQCPLPGRPYFRIAGQVDVEKSALCAGRTKKWSRWGWRATVFIKADEYELNEQVI